jgi:hypothetical protein
MPQRTNDFQKLILLLHQQLSPGGSRITESNMVRDPDTGQLREVDITIESDSGFQPITLLIECRDHKRKQTIEWIEQLIGKYMDRTGRAIVAVSSSGFTSDARRKALRHNILPLSFEEAQDTEWLSDLKAYPTMTISFTMPELAGVDTKLVDKTLKTSDFPPMNVSEVTLYRRNGDGMGTPLTLFDQLNEGDAIEVSLFRHGVTRPDGLLEVGLRLENGAYFIAPDGTQVLVEGIVFLVRLNQEETDVNIEAAKYGPADVATGKARTKTWRVQLAAVRGADRKPHLALSLQHATGVFPPGVLKAYGIPG